MTSFLTALRWQTQYNSLSKGVYQLQYSYTVGGIAFDKVSILEVDYVYNRVIYYYCNEFNLTTTCIASTITDILSRIIR